MFAHSLISDTLANGRTFRTLNLVGDGSRECLAIEIDHGVSGGRRKHKEPVG